MAKRKTRRKPERVLVRDYIMPSPKIISYKAALPAVRAANTARSRKPLHSVAVGDLSKRTMSVNAVALESRQVARGAVLPKYSRLSILNCRKKKKERRRDWFAWKGTGRKAKAFRKTRGRFTVRC